MDTTWMEQAACRGESERTFFPERGESSEPAKAICAGCPVRQECLGYALSSGIRFGVWGGVSDRGHRQLRRIARSAGQDGANLAQGA